MSNESLTITRSTWESIRALPDTERLNFFDTLMSEGFGDDAEETAQTGYERLFDDFRKAYPGSKRGLRVEFDNFRKKYPKEWRRIIPQLMPALQRMEQWRARLAAAKEFVPPYAMLQTWINQRRWETEYPAVTTMPTATIPKTDAPRSDKSAEEPEEADIRRESYERRVPYAYTDKAPVTLTQYTIMGYLRMSDKEFEAELHAIERGEKIIPKKASELVKYAKKNKA